MTAFYGLRDAFDPLPLPERADERRRIRHATRVCRRCRLMRCEALDVECRCEWAHRQIVHPERLALAVHPCHRRSKAWPFIGAALGLIGIAIIIGCGGLLAVGFGGQ